MFFNKPDLPDLPAYEEAPEAPPAASAGEAFDFYGQGWKSGIINSQHYNLYDVYEDHNKQVKELTGADLPNPEGMGRVLDFSERLQLNKDYQAYQAEGGDLDIGWFERKWYEDNYRRQLEDLAKKYPDKATQILPQESFRSQGIDRQQEYLAQREQMDARTQFLDNPIGWAAGTAGSFWSQRYDPIFYMTLPMGGWGAGVGAKAVLMAGAKNGALTAASEAAAQFAPGGVREQNLKAGIPNSVGDSLATIGLAGLTGFGLDVGIRGGYRGIRTAFNHVPVVKDGIVVGWRPKGEGVEAAPVANPAPADTIPEIPPELTQRAASGDQAAHAEIARIIDGKDGMVSNETMARAAEGDSQALARVYDNGARADATTRTLVDTMQADDMLAAKPDPKIDDAAHVDAVAQALRHANDPDSEPIPARVETVPEAPGLLNDLRKRVAELDTELRSNPESADLRAQMADLQSQVQAIDRFGSDPVADAQRLRDNPAILTQDVDTSLPGVKQARSLAALAPEAFDKVSKGEAPPELGQLVSDYVANPNLHGPILSDLMKMKPASQIEGRRMIGDLLKSPEYTAKTPDNLGPVARAAKSPRLLDDPYGSDAKAQVQRLEQQLQEELAAAGRPTEAERLATPEGQAEAITRADEALSAIRDLGVIIPPDVQVRVFSAVDELPPELAVKVRVANAEAYKSALNRFQSARSLEERARARADLDAAGRGEGIEGIADDLNIYIASYAMDPRGRLAHEVLHALKTTGRLSPEEIKVLSDAAIESGIWTDARKALYESELTARYGEGNPRIAETLDEEAAAHYVEAVVRGELPTVQEPKTVGVIERLKQFFAQVRSALIGKGFRVQTGDVVDPAQEIVSALLAGRIAQSEQRAAWMRGEIAPVEAPAVPQIDPAALIGRAQQAVSDVLSGESPQDVLARELGSLSADQTPRPLSMGDGSGPELRPEAAQRLPEISQAIEREMRRMLPDDIALNISNERIILPDGAEAFGYFDPFIKTLFLQSFYGLEKALEIGRHETIHALRQIGLFRPHEWQLLLERARKINIDSQITTRDANGNTINAMPAYATRYSLELLNNGVPPDRIAGYVRELLDQERVAKMAERYFIDKQSQGSKVNKLLDRIKLSLEAVRNAFRGLGFQTADDVFKKVTSGEIGQRGAKGELDGQKGYSLPGDSAAGEAAIFRGADQIRNSISESRLEREKRLLSKGVRTSQGQGEVNFALRSTDNLGFYSKLEEVLSTLKPTDTVTADTLQKRGVRLSEIQARGLGDLLSEGKGAKVSDLQKTAGENPIGVRETQYGGIDAAERDRLALEHFDRPYSKLSPDQKDELSAVYRTPKWASYSLDPNNPTYRETVLHLPSGGRTADAEGMAVINANTGQPMDPNDFRSGHWSEPNVIAHMRSQILTDEKGRKVFNIDELQSDWGQKLRDSGARDEKKIEDLRERVNAAERAWREVLQNKDAYQLPAASTSIFDQVPYGFDRPLNAEGARIAAERDRLSAELHTAMATTPGHPLVNTTDQWTQTALKRLIRQAVESGADAISLTPGKVHAERFGLSHAVDAIDVEKQADGRRMVTLQTMTNGQVRLNVKPNGLIADARKMPDLAGKQLHEVVGKELSDKLMAVENDATFAGNDLKLGGEGMKATYDSMYPRTLGKLLAKMDPSVKAETRPMFRSDNSLIQPERMESGIHGASAGLILSRHGGNFDAAIAEAKAEQKIERDPKVRAGYDKVINALEKAKEQGPTLFTTFPLTDKIKEQVKKDGQPLFAMRNDEGRMKPGAPERAQDLDSDLRDIENALKGANIDEREALQRKRAALLNAKAGEALADDVSAFRNARGEKDEAMAFLRAHETSGREGFGGDDVVTLKQNIMNQALERLAEPVWYFRKGALTGDLRRKINSSVAATMKDMFREAAGEPTNNPLAKKFAKAWLDTAEWLRQSFNAAGGDIGKLTGWIAPQYHNAEALLRGGRDKWVSFLMADGMLDRDRMVGSDGAPLNDADMKALLDDIWFTITTDGANKSEGSGFKGKGALYKRHAEHRVLHFKNADAFMKYADAFGSGDLYAMMIGHISMMSRDIAALRRFGANPELVRQREKDRILALAKTRRSAASLYDELKDRTDQLKDQFADLKTPIDTAVKKLADVHRALEKTSNAEKRKDLHADLWAAHQELKDVLSGKQMTDEQTRIFNEIQDLSDQMTDLKAKHSVFDREPVGRVLRLLNKADEVWKLYSGATNTPLDQGLATGLQAFRNVVSSATLPFASISALSDQATGLGARAFIGMPVLKQFTSFMKSFTPDNRQLALKTGLGLDQAHQAFATQSRFVGWINTRSLTGYLADRTHALSFLSPMTQAAKVGFGWDFMTWMADLARDKDFGDLAPWTRDMLKRHGWTKEDWTALRDVGPETYKGVDVLTRAAIASQAGEDLADKFMRTMLRERSMAVLEPTLEGRAMFVSESKPGTIAGEISRSVAMLKSFPTTYAMLIMGRAYDQMLEGKLLNRNTLGYLAAVFVGGTLLGGLVRQMKDLSTGKDPEDMRDPAFWGKAFMQSGGIGIFGDFIGNSVNRNGSGVANTILGPAADRMTNLFNLTVGNVVQYAQDEPTNAGREAVNFARMNTPVLPFYLRLAYERMLLDEIQKAVDPGAYRAFQAKVRAQKKLSGNDYYWTPGTTSPSRGPNFGRSFGAP